jgi:hypothetical protein
VVILDNLTLGTLLNGIYRLDSALNVGVVRRVYLLDGAGRNIGKPLGTFRARTGQNTGRGDYFAQYRMRSIQNGGAALAQGVDEVDNERNAEDHKR